MELPTMAEAEGYILSNIVFSADGQHFLHLYDNHSSLTGAGGFAKVYARDGRLLFSTEADPSFFPQVPPFVPTEPR